MLLYQFYLLLTKLRNLKTAKSCSVCSNSDQTASVSSHGPYFNCQYQLHCRYVLNCAVKQTKFWVPVFLLLTRRVYWTCTFCPLLHICCGCLMLLLNRYYFPIFFWHFVDGASWYICVITTNKMQFFFFIYFNKHSLWSC